MIVQCDKCTTRFRIADDKILPGGVKVRCSRCAHVFVVGPSPTSAAGENTGQARAPAMSAMAASSVPVESTAGHALGGSGSLDGPNGVSSTAEAAKALGFSGGSEIQGASAAALASPVAVRAPSEPTASGLGLGPSGSASEDFSDIDEAFRRALAGASSDMPAPGVAEGSSFSGEGASARSPTAPLSRSAGSALPTNTPTRPYGETEDPNAPIGALYEQGPKSSSPQVRFPPPSSAIDEPYQVRPATHFPPPSTGTFPKMAGAGQGDMGDIPGLLADDDDPFANIDLDGPSPMSVVNPSDSLGLPPLGHDSGPLPGGVFGGLGATDGAQLADPSVGPVSPGPAGSGPIINLSGSLEPLAEPVPAPRLSSEPLARLELAQVSPPRSKRVQDPNRVPTAVVKAYPGANNRERETEGRWPTLAGILLGLMTLVFLLPDLGQRAVEALLPPGWGVEWAGAVASPTPIQVNRAKVTQYPIKGGKQVLVVAGDARNRTERFLTGVQVVVGVYDGPEKVDERRGWVDVVLTEGQLTGLSSADELQAAYDDAARAHGERGVVLPPATERPFMVVFPNVPDNATHLRFRVSFSVPAQDAAPG